MPATAQLRRTVASAVSTVALVAGATTAVAAPAAATGAPATTATTASTSTTATAATTAPAANRLTKAERKAKKRKKAKIRARKARWRQVRRVRHARTIAMRQRGDMYGYGASGPHRFDCSGLVQFSFRNAGFRGMPRTSSAQAGHARRIPKRALRPGDLMFFTGGSGVYHVGIFVGRGRGGAPRMVHASTSGTPVKVDVPWTSRWFAGTMRPRGV